MVETQPIHWLLGCGVVCGAAIGAADDGALWTTALKEVTCGLCRQNVRNVDVHWIRSDNPVEIACGIDGVGPIGTTTIEYVTCCGCRWSYEAQNRAAAVVRGAWNHVIEERLARLARTEEKLEAAEKALVENGFTEVARGLWKPPVNMAAAKLRELGFQIVDGVWVPPPVQPNPPEVRYISLLDTLELLVRECRKALDK